ncbi:MAG: hypothetical protein JSW59_03185 [Phycisphaerales bacterium]|nr:MAG: hypothetical protein JSW59_03185 [Phycisphaerales bacterium]
MLQYEASVPFSGDLTPAFSAARNVLGSNGFKIERLSNKELVFTGPGMQSNRQNPILGVTRGHLRITEKSIDFSGELGGVEFMRKFLYFFPPGLAIFLMIIFGILGHVKPEMPNTFLWVVPLTVSPWIVLSPLIAKSIKKKTHAAVDTLLHNISNAT